MADSDGCERLRPEIADFEDEGQLAGERDPPTGESDQELGRRRNDDIRKRNEHAAQSGGDTERSIVAHALVGLAVRQGPEPGAKHVYAVNSFAVGQLPQLCFPFGGNDTGGMIGETCEHRNLVACPRPMHREFGGARRGGAHLGREVL